MSGTSDSYGSPARDSVAVVESPETEPLPDHYERVRSFSEELCEPLETEDFVIQSMPDVSPTRWHLAHTTWFFETFVLKPRRPAYEPIEPRYEYMFNSYYTAVGPQYPRPQRGLLSRPTVAEVGAYRRHVDAAMERLLEEADESQAGPLSQLLAVGLNHEQQHQELILTDLKHGLSFNPLNPVYKPVAPLPAAAAPPLRWRSFAGDLQEIGHAGPGFAFDNEGPRHQAYVGPFALAARPVTCGEYLEFMRDGGYAETRLWLSDGWSTVRRLGWRAPLYWEERDGRWFQFTLAGLREIVDAEPVCHVSYFEADAYARWAGARLPTEQEWEVAARQADPAGNFVEAGLYHPAPAAALPGARKPEASRLQQMLGDVWEWTASPYVSYPGFRPVAGALGEYNAKFMCNQLVLRGGSCATPHDHIRITYRNFFPPEARWQFTGIRLAHEEG
jgi:ergothioneine biosynthesis protein EgtB